jgi:hypothetical protein
MLKFELLSPVQIEKIRLVRYDQILEKHEGPWGYDSVIDYFDPEFMHFNDRDVLLPVGRKQHSSISLLRDAISAEGELLTLFLKDTTYTSNPDEEWYDAGRLAICEKMPDEEFYIATVYHEWFIRDGLPPR